MTRKAILVVSFGTSHLDTMAKTIGAIEAQIQSVYAGYQLYRAFTSGIIIKKLQRVEGMYIRNVSEAMEQMIQEGIEQVIVQPTHILNGIEHDKMMCELMKFSERFKTIRVGKPLLSSVADYKMSIHSLMGQVEVEKDQALVLMGHGTDHHANAAYPTLEYTFHALGYSNVLVGTVEGYPDLRNVMAKLEVMDVKRVLLMPFMIVAGDHAKNDMAGEEDSWKSKLLEAGYDVTAILKGLGEIEGIRNMFVEHIKEAM